MSIYNISGAELFEANDIAGSDLEYAYNLGGDIVFRKAPPVLKVMTYNVGQWYIGGGDNVPADKDAEYYALQNGIFERNDVDIACIEEYWDTFSKTGRTALSMLSQYFPYIHTEGGASGYFGRAICSKYPLENWTHHYYSNENRRYFDSAEIVINGVRVTIVVTHLATDSKRYDQITQLISYLSTLDRFICCGDFNTLTYYHTETTGSEDYINIIHPLLEAGFSVANCDGNGDYITYNDASWNGYLDNIITSGTLADIHVDTEKLEDEIVDKVDHMPLIATVAV